MENDPKRVRAPRPRSAYVFACVKCGSEITTESTACVCPKCGLEIVLNWRAEYNPPPVGGKT